MSKVTTLWAVFYDGRIDSDPSDKNLVIFRSKKDATTWVRETEFEARQKFGGPSKYSVRKLGMIDETKRLAAK